MSLAVVMSTWMTSCPPGVPYIGESGWGVSPGWPRSSRPSSASSSSWLRSNARLSALERRRNASEVLAGHGRPNRRRRTYLLRKDAAIRRRRLARGRIDWDPHPPSTWTDQTYVR